MAVLLHRSPIDIPIFGIGESSDDDEIKAYHLLNVCWYTRRCLILDLFEQAERYAGSATATLDFKNRLVDKIKDEITSIDIQSFARKIDHPKALESILPLAEIERDQTEWIRSADVINKYRRDSKEDFIRVLEALRLMKAMNDKYYAASASAFALSVTGAAIGRANTSIV